MEIGKFGLVAAKSIMVCCLSNRTVTESDDSVNEVGSWKIETWTRSLLALLDLASTRIHCYIHCASLIIHCFTVSLSSVLLVGI